MAFAATNTFAVYLKQPSVVPFPCLPTWRKLPAAQPSMPRSTANNEKTPEIL
jgi:hypothetical protein